MSSAPDNSLMKKAQAYFQHGNEAALKNNLDYAISMYREACKLVPTHVPFRQKLREVQRKKLNNDPKSVGRMTQMRIQGIRLKYRGSKSKGRWPEMLEGCEDAFALNPWDVGTSRDAAEAAEGLSQPEMARWLMESVAPQGENDVEYLKHMADVYKLNKDWRRAIQVLERVRKLAPNDEGVAKEINGLAASATIARSGLDRAIESPSRSESIKVDSFSPDVDDLAEQAMAPEQRLLSHIQTTPQRVGPYLELADLYRAQGRLEDAEKVLASGLKANRDDAVLQSAHAEVQISRMHKAREELETRVKKNPDDITARAKLDKLTAMLNDYEIKEFRRRVDQRPEDLNLRMQLGTRLARAGRHQEAITEFQKVRSSPELRVPAQLQAGMSFEATGVLKLAERNYDDALKAADPKDTPNVLELHYRLGRVFEAQGDPRQAEDHYQEVAAIDYGYKDVATRLQGLNRPQSS